MKIIITGATGFIGRALSAGLLEAGYHVVALSRNADRGREILGGGVIVKEWDGKSSQGWKELANGAYGIVNLVGENISNGRWTQKKKQRILQSRLDAGKAVVEAVAEAKKKPRVVIQSSGIGYYGSTSDEMIDESSPPGKGFLVEVADQWEASSKQVESLGTRHVIIRTGVVLGSEGGAFPRLLTPFRFFVGGPLGSGKQWLPWIHLHDEVKAIRFLMEKEDLNGPFNLCAPEPITMKEFSQTLGKIMRRPSWLPIPGLMLRLLFGQMAEEALLSGQRALPRRLLDGGYRFKYPNLNPALEEILS
jgi:uncharacterized protein (TIGR01777 family)